MSGQKNGREREEQEREKFSTEITSERGREEGGVEEEGGEERRGGEGRVRGGGTERGRGRGQGEREARQQH